MPPPTTWDIFSEYIELVIRNGWALVPGGLFAVIRFLEYTLVKQFPISREWRIGIALGGLVVGQFMAYRDLRIRAWNESAHLGSTIQKLIAEKAALESSSEEKDRRIADLKQGNDSVQSQWIADVRFRQSDQPMHDGKLFATWIHIYPDAPIRPPIIRVELTSAIKVSKYDVASLDSRWVAETKMVAPEIMQIELVGPSIEAGDQLTLNVNGSSDKPVTIKRVLRFGLTKQN